MNNIHRGLSVKYRHIVFLVLSSNVIIGMEAERKSLASFFCVEQFVGHEDITKEVVKYYLCDKQWWYVDKEIQYAHQCNFDIPWQHKQFIAKRNNCYNVGFNRDGTEIVAWPVHANCYSFCIWDRKTGEELERINYAEYEQAKQSVFYDQEIWKNNRLYSWSHTRHYLSDNERYLWGWKQASYNGKKTALVIIIRPGAHDRTYKVRVDGTRIEPFFLVCDGAPVNMARFNPQGEEIITASDDRTMRLWHSKTGQELLRVIYDTCVTSALFNELGTEMVVATDDGKIQIFAQYRTDNLQQILLKKLLHVWLQLQKPNKEIDSPEKLLDTVAPMLRCNYDELCDVWKSFPENMRQAMWLSMHKKIQRYGK